MKKSTTKARKTFSNPLEAGRHFLELKENGLSVEEISKKCKKSIPAVYKYMQLAETSPAIQKYIDDGLIPSTRVIFLMDNLPKGQSLFNQVRSEVSDRKKRKAVLDSEGISKMTIKRRLKMFQDKIQSAPANKNTELLLDFASKVNSGASLDELISIAQDGAE